MGSRCSPINSGVGKNAGPKDRPNAAAKGSSHLYPLKHVRNAAPMRPAFKSRVFQPLEIFPHRQLDEARYRDAARLDLILLETAARDDDQRLQQFRAADDPEHRMLALVEVFVHRDALTRLMLEVIAQASGAVRNPAPRILHRVT